ncbi:hypothetical protein V6N13_031481 [Hibiscus sabdariffa]
MAESSQGCVYISEAYKVYWTSCVKGIHTGNMVLRLVEAIVMLILGMGLYGLFISNSNNELSADVDRALKGSSLFGMFAMKERPKWMKISSLDELKTKMGHVIVMILLVKMFERSKNGSNKHWHRSAYLFHLYLPLLCFSLHPSSSSQA